MTQWRSEFRPMPIAPQPVLHGPLADLLEWQAMAQGAYSANTLRAQKADGAIFQAYCETVGVMRSKSVNRAASPCTSDFQGNGPCAPGSD